MKAEIMILTFPRNSRTGGFYTLPASMCTIDYPFISAFSNISPRPNGSLPKRGEKDFEPNGTNIQATALAESRNAMYTALQGERGHAGYVAIFSLPDYC